MKRSKGRHRHPSRRRPIPGRHRHGKVVEVSEVSFTQATGDWGEVTYFAIIDDEGNTVVDGPVELGL